MDKMMKRLGVEVADQVKDGIHVVHCTSNGRPCGGDKTMWLIVLQGYALKLNLALDDIPRQPIEEMEAVQEALEQSFEYLNHLLAYKYVKYQIAIVLKPRWGALKKKIERGEDQPHNCLEAHWKQLQDVLAQEATIERAERITKICVMQKNASWVGRLGDHGVEERMVSAFPLANLFSMFMLMVKWIYTHWQHDGLFLLLLELWQN